ncbi:hypothetical protein JL720_887 [Aureococcus anophagefferens]|nr:hypothetical protein JL720_887 [Aureococcus anophagefferens]
MDASSPGLETMMDRYAIDGALDRARRARGARGRHELEFAGGARGRRRPRRLRRRPHDPRAPEADERAALIYVDGALALELPDKRWALLGAALRGGARRRGGRGRLPSNATVTPVVASTQLRCDGGGVFGGAATVAVVVDDEDCDEDVTVVDAFTYWDERDHVATRRRELAGLADVHVAVEGDRSFRGAPKAAPPLESFGNVVVHAKALKPPREGEDEPDYFDREAAQRDGIADALEALGDALGLDGDDLVLVGDVDEVPSARAAVWNSTTGLGGPDQT